MTKVPGVGGKFLRTDDFADGDRAVIETEANWQDTQFLKEDGTKQQQYVCQVNFKGETRQLRLTMASCQSLVEYGDDSKDWIGKEITLSKIRVMVGGKTKWSILAEAVAAEENHPTSVTKTGSTVTGNFCACDPSVKTGISADGFCLKCGGLKKGWDE